MIYRAKILEKMVRNLTVSNRVYIPEPKVVLYTETVILHSAVAAYRANGIRVIYKFIDQ